MRFLVTGGAGFLGSHISRRLIEQGHEVVIIDDLSGGFKENIPKGAKFRKGDISGAFVVDSVFKEYGPFDYVYHTAAYAAEGLSHFIRNFNYTSNVIGSINLINASIKGKVKCFIFTSSMAVYGTQQVPYSEDLKPSPEDPYGIAKYSVEQDLKTAYEMFGMNYIIFRPHNIYGINQNIGDKYRNVIGIFMNQCMKGKPITVFGDGEQTRAFSYIDDMTPIMADAFDKKEMYQEIFNIGGDTPYTINELAEAVREAIGCYNCRTDKPCQRPEIIHLAERYEVKHAHSNHDKIRKHFELEQTPLKEGIQVMADWATKVGAQESKEMKLELTENLYEAWK